MKLKNKSCKKNIYIFFCFKEDYMFLQDKTECNIFTAYIKKTKGMRLAPLLPPSYIVALIHIQ